MREKKQGKRKVRRRLRLADTQRNTVLAAAVGGASTAFVNGLVSLVAEAVRAVLEH
ncbi:hypothetical protein R6V09_14240 [Streptomyces sp. W16]|uniref:hypothetical protein n=1 Tax=Streptomyces sp. W16 TaxID=3076631 RepID=UPI00295B91D9|nr:hypothetical protein [Streptomyces sp. W16]MDV9171275.1 hypothetical protein [Streptomyces sp. W16]